MLLAYTHTHTHGEKHLNECCLRPTEQFVLRELLNDLVFSQRWSVKRRGVGEFGRLFIR
jgi:hypothetical protein